MEGEETARTLKPAAAETSRGAAPARKNRNELLMPRGHRNGGRPSKGDRHLVSTRIPVAEAEKLLREVDRQGITMSDYLASLIQRDLKDIDAAPDSP